MGFVIQCVKKGFKSLIQKQFKQSATLKKSAEKKFQIADEEY